MIVTLVPESSARLISVFRIFALSWIGVKKSGFPPPNDPPEVGPVEVIVTLYGSNNHSPEIPFGAEACASPNACRLFLDEVSIKPPLPPSAPPKAVIFPKNPVYSSDQRITFPPSPFSLALAEILASGNIATAFALGTSRLLPK